MNFKIVKNIAKASCAFAIALAAMTLNTTEAQAQDLIARQAPIDRKMKAADSVVINRALKQQPKHTNLQEVNFEQTDLYSTWNTSSVHCYANQAIPDKYRIDLRGFAMPTPSRVVTSNFGYRASFGRMHKGIDVKVYIGDTIVSAFDGKVRIVNYEAKGYGNYVVIRHNNGLETIYGHLSKHLCKVGDIVRAGQPIGLGGNTGRSTGSHLHFETRIVGEAINPALLFDFVHQDVTCDFFEYRRNGNSSAGTRTQTAAKPAETPKNTTTPATKQAPATAPKAAPAPAVKVETPSKSQKESAPAKTPKEAVAKVTTKPANSTQTAAKTKSVNTSTAAKTTAQPAKQNTQTAKASTQTGKANTQTAKTTAPAKAPAQKATAKATPAKTTQSSSKAPVAKAGNSSSSAKSSSASSKSSSASSSKSSSSKSNAHSVQSKSSHATAKTAAPKAKSTNGHTKKA